MFCPKDDRLLKKDDHLFLRTNQRISIRFQSIKMHQQIDAAVGVRKIGAM